jgi:TatD family-associated radical SAM protein
MTNYIFPNKVSSTESDEVTFAGQGEPLLRYDTICEAAVLIKMKRHGVPLRLKTNGLVTSSTCPQIVSGLRQAGFSQLTVHLAADNPKQYMELMKPTMDLNFGDVCSFILAAVEAELEVTCTAVDVPGIDMSSVRALSVALGAVHFRPIKYFP